MPNNETDWTQDLQAEAAILHAVTTVIALQTKIDPQIFNRAPSLRGFIAIAGAVANEIGWRDEPSDEIQAVT